jgi:hypothetical protein
MGDLIPMKNMSELLGAAGGRTFRPAGRPGAFGQIETHWPVTVHKLLAEPAEGGSSSAERLLITRKKRRRGRASSKRFRVEDLL